MVPYVLILVELGVAVVAGVVFVAAYARRPWRYTPAGRHLMAVTVAMVFEAASLLLLGLGVRLWVWWFVLGFGAIDAVVIHRLILLWRAGRRSRRETSNVER